MNRDVRLICFYLPQYHSIPENDRWWGKGFTDWVNVVKAKPLFPSHYQPHLPGDLGFYDLRVPEVREAQATLASEYGIYGFCYHYYWFGGHRLLERPFNEVLASGKPDFPFCVCWANENWTRRWDGLDHEILIQQKHSEEEDVNFIRSLFPAFRDKRYIRVSDKPLLIVYRVGLLPNPARTAAIWREQARAAGFDDLYLCLAETFIRYGEYTDPCTIGFDAAIEFPPHGSKWHSLNSHLLPLGTDFAGYVFDYEHVVSGALMRPTPSFKLFRGIMPGWDNTARKRNNGYIYVDSSPELYGLWLANCIKWTREHHSRDERLVFINAWNEWAEGCHLEPDMKYGHRYLETTRAALESAEKIDHLEHVTRAFQANVMLKMKAYERKVGWKVPKTIERLIFTLLPDHTRRRNIYNRALQQVKIMLQRYQEYKR